MTDFLYRDAVAADAAALAAFARETWLATFGHLPYPPEDLDAYLTQNFAEPIQREEIAEGNFRYRLACDGAGIAGYCMMGPPSLPVDDGLELCRLYLHERAKGKGVADELMDDCIAWARAHGAHSLYLSVWEENFRAQHFYRRHGFEDFGEWKFMVGNTADRDLIWRLALR